MRTILFSAMILDVFVAACGYGNGNTTLPTVTSTVPADGAADVMVNTVMSATFSKAMDPTTISVTTFTLEKSGGASVTGSVDYDTGTQTATFTPAEVLAWYTEYTATITTGAKDEAGNGLEADHAWSFVSFVTPP